MLASFSEFKFFQSFRIPVEEADNLRFLIQQEDEIGNFDYINDAKLVDISITGFGFKTHQRISVGTELEISLQFFYPRKHSLEQYKSALHSNICPKLFLQQLFLN